MEIVGIYGEGVSRLSTRPSTEHAAAWPSWVPSQDGREGAAVRPMKTAELIAREIRRRIVRQELLPDDLLPPASVLSKHFRVSRPTLREALRILEIEGLIEIRLGVHGGAKVRVPTAENAARYAGLVLEYKGATLEDVSAVRMLLEPPAIARLAKRRSDADLAELAGLVDMCDLSDEATVSTNAIVEAQASFHVRLVELSGNMTLALFSRMAAYIFQEANRRYMRHASESGTGKDIAGLRGAHRSHQALLALIESRDANAAEAFWYHHLETSLAILKGDPSLDEPIELSG